MLRSKLELRRYDPAAFVADIFRRMRRHSVSALFGLPLRPADLDDDRVEYSAQKGAARDITLSGRTMLGSGM